MGKAMPKEMCRNCRFFIQHYILNNGKLRWVNYGHCIQGRFRNREAYGKICEHYEYQAPVEDGYADREYLSKELLQKVLSMELLPQLEIREDA